MTDGDDPVRQASEATMMYRRVAVQARSQVFREALAAVLAAEADLDVVGAAGTPAELVDLCRRHRPEVVVVDAWDEADPATVHVLRRRGGVRRVVGLATAGERPRPAPGGATPGGIVRVDRGAGLAAVVDAVRGDAARAGRLSPREAEVLRLVGYGMTSERIASCLGIGPKTVERHRRRICEKLGVRTVAHAVAISLGAGPPASEPERHVVGR